MGRKAFISVLGTGFYQDCLYAGQNSQTKTNFIQVATLNEIGAKNWACEDAVYILVTEKARKVVFGTVLLFPSLLPHLPEAQWDK